MRFKLSNKIKGILSVSLANFLSLGVSLLTSFILPLFLSVKEYGYWQLFVMYSGYVGFFAFGFNDGVHLHYAGENYDKEIFPKFSAFRKMLSWITIVETLVFGGIILFLSEDNNDRYLILLLTVLNIIPVIINGYFTYINQSTMRFKQYSRASILERIIFLALMLVMLIAGSRNTVQYIIAYTFSRYFVIAYNFFSSREIFVTPALSLRPLKKEIIRNFRNGFALMIAGILNGSIIVVSRIVVESRFGIEEFGMFSFALHTLVVASQFITAIASVFYPILKRSSQYELKEIYCNFDRVTTILSAILLISYYAAALLINLMYHRYIAVLNYLFVVYPLFIFQCKSNLLIINIFKVHESTKKLILTNLLAIIINIICVAAAYTVFQSVSAIAVATLIGYILWYYICQIIVCREENWDMRVDMFSDVLITLAFILTNHFSNKLMRNEFKQILVGLFIYLIFLGLLTLVYKKKYKEIICQTAIILKD